ncbi:hypothetical protein EMCRGX_G013816 [Ephydatia muelleri]
MSPASGHVICFIHLTSHMRHQFVWILFQVRCSEQLGSTEATTRKLPLLPHGRTEAVLVQRLQRNLNSVAAKVNSFEQMCSSENTQLGRDGRRFRSRFRYITVTGFWSRDMFYSSHEPHESPVSVDPFPGQSFLTMAEMTANTDRHVRNTAYLDIKKSSEENKTKSGAHYQANPEKKATVEPLLLKGRFTSFVIKASEWSCKLPRRRHATGVLELHDHPKFEKDTYLTICQRKTGSDFKRSHQEVEKHHTLLFCHI